VATHLDQFLTQTNVSLGIPVAERVDLVVRLAFPA
jgi:hypothetical protein